LVIFWKFKKFTIRNGWSMSGMTPRRELWIRNLSNLIPRSPASILSSINCRDNALVRDFGIDLNWMICFRGIMISSIFQILDLPTFWHW
jgi:hypothetical protein